jgi:hypothetical protein
MNIFPTFLHLKIFLPIYESPGFPFVKWPFLDVSDPEKPYSLLRRNVGITVHEITICFRRFETWINFLATGERRRFLFAKWSFLRYGAWEKFLASSKTAGLPFLIWPIFQTFRDLKFSSPPEKRRVYLSRSEHFFTFRRLKNRFLTSCETARLPFPKWLFPKFRDQNPFPATGETALSMFSKRPFLDISDYEKA